MSLLIESLESIFNWLEENNPSVANSLQPGLSYEEIEEKIANFPFRLPKEFYELYQWRNGNPENSNGNCIDFFECYRFMPLEESYQMTLGILEDNQLYVDSLFPYGWFPLFTFEGEYFGIIGSEQQRYHSPIVNIYEEETLTYISLTSMMQTIAECYQTGAYYLNEDGYCEIQGIEEEKIILKYNPGVLVNSHYGNYDPEIIKKSNRLKITNTYSTDRSFLIRTDIENYQSNLGKRIEYLGGRVIRRQTSPLKQESYYDSHVIEERFYCDEDKYERQEIATRKGLFKWEVTYIKRRYVNELLQQEKININVENKLFQFVANIVCYLVLLLLFIGITSVIYFFLSGMVSIFNK